MPLRRNQHSPSSSDDWLAEHRTPGRIGRWRQVTMAFALVILLGVIFGYGYLTNPHRLRLLAQSYLSEALDTPVEVGNATLSVFEGLRLDNVKVKVDQANRPDSILLTAQTFLVRYNLRAMLGGDLDASQIVAVNPRLFLSQDTDTGQLNFQRLIRPGRAASRPRGAEHRPVVLPQILLRNAEIEYSEITHGRYVPLGVMRIDGQLSPTHSRDRYHFEFQSRNAGEGVGPTAGGTLDMRTGEVEASLINFQFDQSLLNLLPAAVRQWGRDHELSGRIDLPVVRYVPGRADQPAGFQVDVTLKDVDLGVHPREWMGHGEIDRRMHLTRTGDFLRGLAGTPVSAAAVAQRELLKVPAVRLDDVTGTFSFTPGGIDIRDLTGRIESNTVRINGRIGGYSPDAPMDIQVASLPDQPLFLSADPEFVGALPGDIRELYEHLRPQGSCKVWVRAIRAEPGAPVRVRGEVDILDGQFQFDEFPYPLRQATGKIVFGPDSKTGIDRCDIINLRGLGVPGGPNANAVVSLEGSVVPLGDDAEVNIRLTADHVVSEPVMIQSMPADVRETLRMFAADESKQTYPDFSGGFVCNIHRPPGPHQRWRINLDLRIDDSNGAFEFFPYPLEHVSGNLHIGYRYVDIDHMAMRKGDLSLDINGRVEFGGERPVRPDLTITARNIPLDDTFIHAIPGAPGAWVKNAGLAGMLDIDGRVTRPVDAQPIMYDLGIDLRNGTIWPVGTTYALGNVRAKLQLTPDSMVVTRLQATRGEGVLTGTGVLSGLESRPHLVLKAEAKNLLMESSLYQLLPAGGREAWDQVRPVGTLDADLTCQADLGPLRVTDSHSTTQPATTVPAARAQYDLTLRPVRLSMTPQVFPYLLNDVGGSIRITDDGVTLTDMTAHHEQTRIALSGTAGADTSAAGSPDRIWKLKLALSDAPVDTDLVRALPPTLKDLFKGLKLAGKLSAHFDQLQYRAAEEPDINFSGSVSLADAHMETGVSLDHVNGDIRLKGNVHKGRLDELQGSFDVPALTMAGRPATGLRGQMTKAAGQDVLKIDHLQTAIAGGEMAGQVQLRLPREGTSHYSLGLVLRNADVQALTDGGSHDIQGRLSASLSLEGDWSDPASRRGRGDVTAAGPRMYRIPLLLGLMQITNLSLPVSRPFSQASARYSVEGNHVTFDQIELRSDTMAMQGSGQLDFDTKQVRLGFVVDNPNSLQLPFISQLFSGFKQQLLRINVNGTIEQLAGTTPEQQAYQTTVDKVYAGQ